MAGSLKGGDAGMEVEEYILRQVIYSLTECAPLVASGSLGKRSQKGAIVEHGESLEGWRARQVGKREEPRSSKI